MRRPIRLLAVLTMICLVLFVYVRQKNIAATPAAAPPPSKAAAAAVVKGSNQFAFDLYAKLRAEKDGNLFFSPQSISTALAMTYAGARGETAKQMTGTLHFDLPADKLHPAEAALLNHWNGLGKQGNVQLSVANRLWGQQGYKFLDSFVNLLRNEYGAGLEQLDYAKTEAARQTINAWVEKTTAGKIKDLIPKNVLSSSTRLVLTNAVYFKGDWQQAFRKAATETKEFFLSAADKIDVPIMHQTGHFRFGQAKFADEKTLKLLEMSYKGQQLSLVVLLPEATDGLVELEQHLSAENLQRWLDDAKPRDVMVWLPKFKTTNEFSLKDVLPAMGMTAAFDQELADFSGMTGKKDLFISAVVHKAFVDVNEEGTEAAAATGVAVEVKAALPEESPTFRADHPFVFLIRDNTTGAILFMGRVVDPR